MCCSSRFVLISLRCADQHGTGDPPVRPYENCRTQWVYSLSVSAALNAPEVTAAGVEGGRGVRAPVAPVAPAAPVAVKGMSS